MKLLSGLGLSLAAVLVSTGAVLAHIDENGDGHPDSDEPGAIVVDHWRDQVIPSFDTGDPNTRHDGDSSNDQSRDDPDTIKGAQRWRDDVKTTGEEGQVGDGCTYVQCTRAGDENGDYLQVDQSLSPGPSGKPGDPNKVHVGVLGGGAVVDFGGRGSGFNPVPTGATSPTVTPDDSLDSDRGAPSRVSAMTAADHSLLSAAHSPSDHGNAEFNQHDTHGGTMWLDVYLPSEDDPDRLRDSNYGFMILDHLDCPPCFDEYHTIYPFDPERTTWQVSEMPDQAEHSLRDPDRWIFGYTPSRTVVTPTVGPVADAAFDEAVNPVVDPAIHAALGTGATSSACCAAVGCPASRPLLVDDADPNGDGLCCTDATQTDCTPVRNAGRSCNPTHAANWTHLHDRGGLSGCSEVADYGCIGGSAEADGEVTGCVGLPDGSYVTGPSGPGASSEACTQAAVDACCANGGCI